MKRTYQRTVKAESAGGWNVAVTFADGTRGTFDFSPFADYPCYSPLKKPGVFACVRADHGTLAWPGEIDIAPETVWRQVASSTRSTPLHPGFPQLITTAAA